MSTSDPKVITMVVCPYCDEEWVREDDELVCKDCEPMLKADLAVASLIQAISDLGECGAGAIQKRRDLLVSAHHNLTQLIKKPTKKQGKKR